MELTFGTIFLGETVGTAVLILLGCGTVANTLLTKSKGKDTGFLFVNFGWGLAVMMGVLVAGQTGGHLNPAVTIGVLAAGTKLTATQVAAYILGQFAGAMIGATLCWVAYKEHYDEEPNPALKLATFSTAPEIRKPLWNCLTEIVGTFVLVFVVVGAGVFGAGAQNLGWLNALGVGLLIVVIGIALGGPTGYAINPARDLGPRIMHAILPIKGKGSSDWGYAWVPVVAPMIGGVLGGLVGAAVF
ncbi:MIP/aquaporin family protein [Tessaracoccus sp. OH4464_COT-324]|uniref:MIP/aquaporin family protein n=1 Tax=Tessaracoccus sp. OH4464_COT-324 TaxID=2491059 RepID=UPI000F6306F9|nr:MIP/aquaporin family protein [Tessaracoccus sp. OH4464_COT-324]RRD46269.1 aquaporin family protein [Tessaracoccus sp. OH4464_COT-324]